MGNYFIGITGIVGSGKTTVSNILREWGYCVFDVDAFSRYILMKDRIVIKALEDFVPKKIVKDGKIDYKQTGKYFDSNPELEYYFESWFQPYLGSQIIQKYQHLCNNEKFIFFDIPLLEQKGISEMFELLWIIKTDESICYKRIKTRNGYSDEKINRLLTSSKTNEKYCNCVTINNNGSIENLKKLIDLELTNLKLRFND